MLPIWQISVCDGQKTLDSLHIRVWYIYYWFVNTFVHQQVKDFFHKN